MISTKISGNYAAGLSTPFRADTDGGALVVEGEEYVRQLILTAMGTNESDNPFQDLGVGEDSIFKVSADPRWKASLRRRIKAQLDLLDRENLARFVRLDMPQDSGSDGSYTVELTYLNLETQKESTLGALVAQNGDVNLRPL
jgi:hypothetical protein